jgi:hypothetical protein
MAWFGIACLNLPASLFAWHNVHIHVVRQLSSLHFPANSAFITPGSGIRVVHHHPPRIATSWSIRYLNLLPFRLFFSFLSFHRYPMDCL